VNRLIISYDKVADALYIRVRDGKVKESTEIREGVIVDLDDDGVIGVEILNFSKSGVDLGRVIREGIEILVSP